MLIIGVGTVVQGIGVSADPRVMMEGTGPAPGPKGMRESDAMTKVSRAETLRAELARFVGIVAADPHTRQVMVFGSLTDATTNEWSDLDLVVVMETDLPFLERVRRLQRRVRPQVAVDLMVYTPDEWAEITETRPFVRDEIVAKGQTVYDRSVTTLT